MKNCQATIDNRAIVRTENRGRGFGRRAVCIYFCPVCGAQRDMIKNWSGPPPNGAFICGAIIPEGGAK